MKIYGLLIFLFFIGNANAAVTLSNGVVTFDSSNNLTRFEFTLTSDVVGETISSLGFDADGGGSWDAPNAATVFESNPWTPIGGPSSSGFYNGSLDSPVVFDGVSGINFDFIFEGPQNVLGNPWQISAGNVSPFAPFEFVNNADLAIVQAGNVVIPSASTPENIPTLSQWGLIIMSMLLMIVGIRQKGWMTK